MNAPIEGAADADAAAVMVGADGAADGCPQATATTTNASATRAIVGASFGYPRIIATSPFCACASSCGEGPPPSPVRGSLGRIGVADGHRLPLAFGQHEDRVRLVEKLAPGAGGRWPRSSFHASMMPLASGLANRCVTWDCLRASGCGLRCANRAERCLELSCERSEFIAPPVAVELVYLDESLKSELGHGEKDEPRVAVMGTDVRCIPFEVFRHADERPRRSVRLS